MFEWKKICCAVDFAAPSRAAMEQAADAARRYDAELALVHVIAPIPPADIDLAASSAEMARITAEKQEEMLEAWRVDAEQRAGRAVRSHLLRGNPTDEIVRFAREERCDLLVVGTHGRSGVARVVLGSVAERVGRQSPCPVLVVRDQGVIEKEDVAREAGQYI